MEARVDGVGHAAANQATVSTPPEKEALAPVVADFGRNGYVVLPAWLSTEALAPAQAELTLMFPSPQDYHGGKDPKRAARFAKGAFAGVDPFPYESVEWSLIGLSPPIVTLAEALLGTSAVRLYEGHNWAKYAGAADYEQELHRDFGNHTPVVPTADRGLAEVEMFVYIHDVPPECGPTRVVSQVHTRGLPIWPPRISRATHPHIYAHEVSAAGPAGTVLAYRTDTFHRGTAVTDPTGARFVLKASFRTVSDIWFDKLGLTQRLGDSWYRFVARATPRQLELAGFPPRGHRYWTPTTWADVCSRYPNADLSAFRPMATRKPLAP
jgi:ectoine hydroxylase-related dioxygenase (phytanoyl-CoA dioxygenase family)